MNRKKSEQVFHELSDRNCGRWNGIARCYAAPEERDDLLQEMHLQIWRSLPSFKQQAQIDTWAYRVALNTALGWDRKRKWRDEKLPRDTMDDLATLAESQSSTADTQQRILDQFIATLSDSQRAVLLLFMDDMPQDASAQVLGISPAAYRVRVHRLKKKFEETFQLDRRPSHES